MTWREILYGLDNELMGLEAAVALAVDDVARQADPSGTLVELACIENDSAARALVERLANAEGKQDADQIRAKWLYLTLAWVFEHRANYPDPLQVVEEVYADFGYPQHITGFVRYMPAAGPDLGSRELNEQHLHEKWRRYLEELSSEYSPSDEISHVLAPRDSDEPSRDV